jgi:formylglycine-generating enzyme required for sulfatase activity
MCKLNDGFFPSIEQLIPGLSLRLPTEQEWECACRAGTNTPFWWGRELSRELANYDGSYPYNEGPVGDESKGTLDVLSYYANPWGLYQMHGNVWEWCQNLHDNDNDNDKRVVRGGSWVNGGRNLHHSYRLLNLANDRYIFLGFRVVADLVGGAKD